MIGAGSIGFTRRLLRDILTVPELRDTAFAFTDISRRNLEMVAALCRREIAGAKRRLAAHGRAGTRAGRNRGGGAARRKVKSLREMRADRAAARANAAAADKGGMTAGAA